MGKAKIWIAVLILALTITGCSAGPDPVAQDTASTAKNGSQQELRVTYLDVGQGDSTFVELPDQKCMLIDAAEPEYSKKIEDYIRSKGYDTIDYLVATHPHSDHIGGMSRLVDKFDVGAVYMPKVQTNTHVFEDLLTSIKEKHLKIKEAKADTLILKEDDLEIRIVSPTDGHYSDLNDYSAVLYMTYGNNSFLFMGDAEKKSENQIKEKLQADVLKVGHHGSEYSSGTNFLKKVAPEYAIISCGKGNKYGHPDSDTLKNLKKIGSNIFRTDKQGNIVIVSDGSDLTVSQKQTAETGEAKKQQGTGYVVYVTKSGSKYHKSDCHALKSSAKKMTVKKAEEEGYEPCAKCNP